MSPQPLIERSAPWVELRATDDGDGRTLEGYAAVFDTPTRIDGWEGTFDEIIARGAFKKTLRERTPVLQFDHGHDARTGSVPIGKIELLREDAKGLFVRARLFDNPVVEPIRQAIEGGAIDGMSFRFRVLRDEWAEPDDKARQKGAVPQRTVREVQLFELGPVVFPAYDTTSVGVREQTIHLSSGVTTSAWRAGSGMVTVVPPGTPVHVGRTRPGLGEVENIIEHIKQYFAATSDDAARTSDDLDAAGTSEDAGTPTHRVDLPALRRRALILKGIIE